MLSREVHASYVSMVEKTKDVLYYISEPFRITTVYWAINSLKMLNSQKMEEQRASAISFVKSCLNDDGGFGGNTGLSSTVIFTFNALQILFLYDVPYYNTKTVDFLVGLQQPDGSFVNDKFLEKDTRIDCCAILSLRLLEIMEKYIRLKKDTLENNKVYFVEKSIKSFNKGELKEPISDEYAGEINFNKHESIHHLLDCYNDDGGFGQIIGSESHAAQVFCCVSSLRSLGALDAIDRSAVEDFLVFRQCPNGGLNGRINKKEDVCYSFWTLASLKLIGSDGIDSTALRNFIYSCEGENGGFSDRQGNECDLYHLMYSLASFCILGIDGFESIDPGFAL
ncbi:geranylgeranyl transferase type-2 subunit beta [Pancytospora epiphaga]|nr:geranylgeranyl transferase type-2 subunit beta [Pancytospora epiphaga]